MTDQLSAADAGLSARTPAGPPAPVDTPAPPAPTSPAGEEVRLVSEGFVDGVELFTWYDGAGQVLAEHTPLDPALKQCGC